MSGAPDSGRSSVPAAMNAAEGHFRRIIEAVADAIVVVGEDGVVRFSNPAASEIFGRSREELEGEHFGFPLPAGENTEVEIHPREGEHRVAEMRVVALDWDGEPALLASLRDVTDRRRLEELRAEQAETRAQRQEAEVAARRMQLLADAGALLASSLALTGPLERLVRLVVPRLADWCLVVLDQGSVEASRRSAFYTHAEPGREKALEELLALYQTDRVQEIFEPHPELVADGEAWLAKRDEDVARRFRDAGLTSAIHLPLLLDDQTVGCMTFARSGAELPPSALTGEAYDSSDLTLVRELGRRITLALESARLYRQAERASRMRDEFMAKVSHEMRTPLQAILGWTSILKQDERLRGEGGKDGRLGRAVEVIERNAESQVHLIEDILDVSRIITGKLSLERETVAVRDVIHPALDSLVPAAEDKDVEIVPPAEADGFVLVQADPHRLQQVITNLVSNAVKYTPSGGRVAVEVEVPGEEAVVIRVRDDGKGIPADVLPHVFNPFRQGDSQDADEKSASGGLGLGLAIVRQLVEMHGGEVSADSPGPGQGSVFEVRLPLADTEAAGRTRKPLLDSPDTSPGARQNLAGLRLAVVDDEADTRDLLETALTDVGARVWTADGHQQFFQRLDEVCSAGRLPDVLISDIGMPGGDGYDLLRDLRARPAEEGGEIPAVALTGYARPEDQGRALDSGFARHLAKPVSLSHLAHVIAELAGSDGGED